MANEIRWAPQLAPLLPVRISVAERIGALKPGADGKLPLVTLRADKTLDYGRVIAVMGELNRAGITSISLVTGATAVEPLLTAGSGTGQ